ncbi:archaetidylserine decarboxylase [Salinicola rhizosphaerae]|uniref:Phosphatidylserine decarboxylase proenzyme n=1 Tax=Salinicola rhizosphaerae TaxID=1443141 RepID=A0ABQ3E8S8_9GAMM|nr:phosphatidylserine decarboxylase proenzyme [Salinicola rhizosphaerae]
MDRQELFARIQYPLPQHAISRLIGKLADCRLSWIKDPFIQRFIKIYGVDMSQAHEPDPTAYACFNDFFTRALKPDARPIGEDLVSPADGVLSRYGRIEHGTLIQAKGQTYSLSALLGGDTARAAPFRQGSFATVYLSPKDYHRVHMPVTGTLREMTYVPGRLFSVNSATANHVPGLFARNERLVCIFDTEQGPLAMVLVGAMIVAAIETVWAGQITPLSGKVQTTRFDEPIVIEKGQEMGRFKLGSTVVMCFGRETAFGEFDPEGSPVSMGQTLGALPGLPATA